MVPDNRRKGAANFLNGLLYQLSILPNSFAHCLTVGITATLRNGLDGAAVLIIVDHGLAIGGGIPGRLVLLIYRIADQGADNRPCSQPGQGASRVASYGLTDKRACSGAYGSPYLGVVSGRGVVCARGEQER